MVSESGAIVARLVAAGANYQSIGEALGVNRSLPRQWATGAKPGNNMREALAALERRLSTGQAPPRGQAIPEAATVEKRTTRAGTLARVRRPTTIGPGSWTASTVKRSASRNGARQLGHPLADAADRGQQVAATISFASAVSVQAYGNSGRGQAGPGGSLDIKLGDAREVWATVHDAYGGNVAAYLADVALDRGLVSGSFDHAGNAAMVAGAIDSIELRAFTEPD